MQDATQISGRQQDRQAGRLRPIRPARCRLSLRLQAVLIACAWSSGMMAGHPAARGATTTVRLLPTAVVSGDDVTLADVAEISGESAELIAGWTLGAAPRVGQTGAIDLDAIQKMLARRGVNLSAWIFRGANRCVVQRVAPQRRLAEAVTVAADAAPGMPVQHEPLRAVVTTRPAADARTLEGVIREHIARRVAHLNGTPVVRFSPALSRVLELSRPTYDFQITDRSDRVLGMVPFEVLIVENGQPRQTVPVLAEVRLRKAVVTASRPINRGETVSESAVSVQDRLFEHVEEIGLTEPAAVIGQRATKFVAQDGMFYPRDIEPVPLVMRNDLVTVTVRRGGLTIRSSAKAMNAASYGERVVLRNEASKETFTATVTGPKTAEVTGEFPLASAEGGVR